MIDLASKKSITCRFPVRHGLTTGLAWACLQMGKGKEVRWGDNMAKGHARTFVHVPDHQSLWLGKLSIAPRGLTRSAWSVCQMPGPNSTPSLVLLACTTGDVRSSAQDRVAAVMEDLQGVAANNCKGMGGHVS